MCLVTIEERNVRIIPSDHLILLRPGLNNIKFIELYYRQLTRAL